MRLKDIDKLITSLELPKDHEGYYLDAFGNRISFNGVRTLKPSFTQLQLTQPHIEEIIKCANSYQYFRANYCIILTKKGYDRPEPREYQRRLEVDLLNSKRNIVLFGRQSGKTVTIATYLLWKALFSKDMTIGIAANKQGMAVEVLDKIKNIFINLPIWLMAGVTTWNKKTIEFENGVRILTSATNGDSFRGFSLGMLYIDETAFIRPTIWKEFEDSVFPTVEAIENSQIIISSTPKGMNHFYDLVQGSRLNVNGYTLTEMEWNEVPGRDETWRKNIIADKGLTFFEQNYGCKFSGSADTLVSHQCLQRIISTPVLYKNNNVDELRVYKEPEPSHKYICSVDSAKDGIDKIAIQMIDVTKFPFVQVAAANLDISYLKLAGPLTELCREYNNAFLVVENNEGAGQSLVDTVTETYDYDNVYKDKPGKDGKAKRYYGFRTSGKSRKVILSMLKTFLENDRLVLNDKETIEELFHFLKINGKYQADDGYHDDLIMALAISFAPIMDIKNMDDQKKFIDNMFSDSEEDEEDATFEEMFAFGSFDDIDDSVYKNEFEDWNSYRENNDSYTDSNFD
jgi:hypothetical protein